MPETETYLGIDIGATKSHALIADRAGRVVGFGHAGPGNYEVVGWDGLRAALHAVTDAALTAAGLTRDALAGAGFGIAGYDWPGERLQHEAAIASLGLTCPTALVNDTIIGLVAGAPKGWGIGIVAGTGANCWGRDPQGREGHMTGGGGAFAEFGGGGDLVYAAVQRIALAWGKRGPATRLTEAFVERVGATSAEDLLEGLYLDRYTVGAEAAPLVFEVAAAGDAVALDTIRWLGRELGSLGVGVIRQLGIAALQVDVVEIGSLYKGSPLLSETMLATIRQVAPRAELLRLAAPPVVGGVLLGMEAAGVDVRPLRETLIASAESSQSGYR